MGFGVLFISLLGSYLFIQRCHFSRLTGSREGCARPFIMDVYERFQSAHRATVTGNDEGGPILATGASGG